VAPDVAVSGTIWASVKLLAVSEAFEVDFEESPIPAMTETYNDNSDNPRDP